MDDTAQTMFQDALELMRRVVDRAKADDLPWLESVAREELADQCQVFLLEYHNR